MAKISTPWSEYTIKKYAGVLDFYKLRGQNIVRKWPDYRNTVWSAGTIAARAAMAASGAALGQVSANVRAVWAGQHVGRRSAWLDVFTAEFIAFWKAASCYPPVLTDFSLEDLGSSTRVNVSFTGGAASQFEVFTLSRVASRLVAKEHRGIAEMCRRLKEVPTGQIPSIYPVTLPVVWGDWQGVYSSGSRQIQGASDWHSTTPPAIAEAWARAGVAEWYYSGNPDFLETCGITHFNFPPLLYQAGVLVEQGLFSGRLEGEEAPGRVQIKVSLGPVGEMAGCVGIGDVDDLKEAVEGEAVYEFGVDGVNMVYDPGWPGMVEPGYNWYFYFGAPHPQFEAPFGDGPDSSMGWAKSAPMSIWVRWGIGGEGGLSVTCPKFGDDGFVHFGLLFDAAGLQVPGPMIVLP